MSSPNLGFLGTGRVALDHARVALSLGARIVAGCSSSPSSQSWNNFVSIARGAIWQTPEEVLLNSEVDAIVCCMPWDLNEKYLPLLLSSGKPTLIEKPPSLSSRSLENLIQSMGREQNQVIVGFNRRHYEIVGLLREKIFGEQPDLVEVHISEDLEFIRGDKGETAIKHLLKVGASSHILDLIFFLLGDIKIYDVFSKQSDTNHDFSNVFVLALTEYEVPVSISIRSSDPVAVGISCAFADESRWVLSPIERLQVFRGISSSLEFLNDGTPRRLHKPELISDFSEPHEFRPGFLEQMRVFLSGRFDRCSSLSSTIDLLKLVERIVGTH